MGEERKSGEEKEMPQNPKEAKQPVLLRNVTANRGGGSMGKKKNSAVWSIGQRCKKNNVKRGEDMGMEKN